MLGGEVNSYPVQLLVNYWELCPSIGGSAGSSRKNSPIAEKLNQLAQQGVSHIATFVPWQVVESDISHMLPRFLQVLAERKMKVSLILTPEVGVHYPNSGLPKDLAGRKEDMAQHCQVGPAAGQTAAAAMIPVSLPPNTFVLPSLFAPEFNKRYHSFLARMDTLLADLGRTQPQLVEGVSLTLTGSYWKYYRSPYLSSRSAFAGPAGDFSASASLSFRQRLQQFYNQREFMDPSPMAANRWKARSLDEVNRRWFFQHSEDVFRNRTYQLVRKKSPGVGVREIELFTPEADPGFCYSRVLQMMSGGHADSAKLSQLIDEAAARGTFASAGTAAPYIHWSSLGGFRSLADSEKQFLILKSLILMGGQGGGILLDEEDWFALSTSFRSRVEAISKLLSAGELSLKTQAVYLASHTWSSGGPLWDELRDQAGAATRLVSSLDYLLENRDVRLVLVDPQYILTRDAVVKLTTWAKAGHVLAIPRSALYTEAARAELESISQNARNIEVNFGVSYRLHMLGSGKMIIYEPSAISDETRASWKTFLNAMLSVAEVETQCRVSDSRIQVIPLQSRANEARKAEKAMGLFVLNETHRQISADVIFSRTVEVSDFASTFGPRANADTQAEKTATIASRFALDIAPCGILSLAVGALQLADERPVLNRQDAVDLLQASPRPGSPDISRLQEEYGTDV